ncbi:MAG: Tetratricopeptide repeat protein [Microgenomates bacterium OLB23]|nr:MAG: Tetratricopeptide repeat protein [Microgenomates bacterium OLB23]
MRFSPVGNVVDTLILAGLLALVSVISVAQSVMHGKKPSSLFVVTMLVGIVAFVLIGYRAVFPPSGQAGLQLPPLQTSWIAAIDSLKTVQTAVTGVGIDNYEAAFTAAKQRSYNATNVWQINFNLASSMLLHIWTESGLLGLVMYMLVWVFVIREVQGLFAERDPQATMYAVWAAYLALVTIALPVSFITLFFTVVLCALLALKNNVYDEQEVSIDLQSLPLLYLSISLILLVAVGAGGYFASRAYAAEMQFKDSLDAVRANDGQKVYNSLVQAIRINPYIERYHVQMSQVNLLLANNLAQKKEKLTDQERQDIARFIQIAISEAKVPVQLNPQKVGYWNNLALVYRNIINVAEGAEAWTVASYRRAILQDPNNPLIRLNLGGVFYSLKDYTEAENQFRAAAGLKPDWPNAYYNLAWAQFQGKKYDDAIVNMENVLKTLDKKSEDYKKAK